MEHVTIADINPKNRAATIVGDLADEETLPKGSFDCVILTQSLMYIYDTRAASQTSSARSARTARYW